MLRVPRISPGKRAYLGAELPRFRGPYITPISVLQREAPLEPTDVR